MAPCKSTQALMRSEGEDGMVAEQQMKEEEGISPQRAQRQSARNSIAESNEQLIAEATEWKPLGLEGVTYVDGDDDGYADDESGYSGDDDGEMYGDQMGGRGRSGDGSSSMWGEDGSDIVWYEVIDAGSGYPYWLHARSGVSQWEPPVWLDQIDPTSGASDVVI
jgi:hypothetical protein